MLSEEPITGWQPILNTVLDVVVAKARMGIVGVSIGDCKEIIASIATRLGRSTTSIEGGFAHLVSQGYVKENDGQLRITHQGWEAYGEWDSRQTGKSREEWLNWSGDNGYELPPIRWNEMSVEQTGDVAKNDAVDEAKADQAGNQLVPVKVEPAVVPVLKGMTTAVNARCARLKKMLGEAQAEVVGIGKDLIAIRDYLQVNNVPGGFDGWITRDFDWSRSQAYRFIDTAKEFGDCPNLGHYDQTALYLLAAPGTPQEAKDEAKQLADTGDFVDFSTAATLIGKCKPALGHEREEELLDEGDDDDGEETSETPPPGEADTAEKQEKLPPAEDADPEKQTPPADAEKTTTPPAPPKKQPEKANRQPVHNYKCGGSTKVIAEQTEPGNLLVTIKSLESPSGNSNHDLLIQFDRKLAAKLHHELGQALAVKSKGSQPKTGSPAKQQKSPPKASKVVTPSKKQQPKPKADKGTITIRKLNSSYGVHAASVLEDYLDELERKDGGMRTYKIAKALPTEAEFKELQAKKYTSTVAELVGSAFGDLENLASEMGDWYDNLPEGFQNSDKGSVLDETRGTLEGLSEPDVPDAIAKKEVYYLPLLNASSRAAQRDDAVGRLQAVVDVLDSDEGDSEIKEFIADLENAIGEAEGVEFPGMY